MDRQQQHPRKPRTLSRYALYRRAIRSTDAGVYRFIEALVPGEDGIPIPGIFGFFRSYCRQLVPVRLRSAQRR